MNRPFSKPSLTIAQQIAHLLSGGMSIADPQRAAERLSHVSYYRLSGYWHMWKNRSSGSATKFVPGTTFDAVRDLYSFDRDLRRLVARATEHVEVALRGSWAYNLAHQGGPHAFLDPTLYSDRTRFHELEQKLALDAQQSRETHMVHYRVTYSQPMIPPVWMAVEIMTFGQLSRWYSLLGDSGLRNRIAAPFGLNEHVFVSIIKHIVVVRNVCSHHSRLWNRGYISPPRLPKKPADLSRTLDKTNVSDAAGRLYNTLVILVFLLERIAPLSTWRADLVAHLLTHPTGDLAAMGFPAGWQARPLWS